MANISRYDTGVMTDGGGAVEARGSAISWPAIFGGTVAALAVSLVLTALGSGFGLAAASPMSDSGPSAKSLTIIAAVWLIVAQWIAGGVGGYLTGRLRTKWAGTHNHEVFFRDTAHGFVMWAVATIIGVMLLASASSSLVSGGARAVAAVGQGAATAAGMSSPSVLSDYGLDTLFRSGQSGGDNTIPSATRAEAGRIFTQSLATGELPAVDRSYLAQMIAAKAGIPQADAEKRIDDAVAQAKAAKAKAVAAADEARKAAAKVSIFTAVAMLIGAFIASTAAALGGRQRDEHP
jgi:hypothetical protein